MCESGNRVPVRVMVPADLAHEREDTWKPMLIDACIAPIVQAFQEAGVNMRGSCCGHGKGRATIMFGDETEITFPAPNAAVLRDAGPLRNGG